jgi:hypothetical protein
VFELEGISKVFSMCFDFCAYIYIYIVGPKLV